MTVNPATTLSPASRVSNNRGAPLPAQFESGGLASARGRDEALPADAAFSLSGSAVRSLMRKHRVTLRSLKQDFGITLTRTRWVREHGVAGFMAQDWFHMLTGAWPTQADVTTKRPA